MSRPILHIAEILAWADAHHARTGKWPSVKSGRVQDAPRTETWGAVDMCLRLGFRGLRRGNSLARLLEKHRAVRNIGRLPKLTRAQILRWARMHRERTGRWPIADSGSVAGTNGETWSGINAALDRGLRGWPGGSSLARLLECSLGVRNSANLPPLSEAKILAWADLHFRKTGDWPNRSSGLVYGSRGETWKVIDKALERGFRSLAGGSSLAKLLACHRGVRKHAHGRRLSVATLLEWAKSHYRRTGEFPKSRSGPVYGKPGETWGSLQIALLKGYRGLPKGTTLSKLLAPLKEKMAKAGRR